MADELIAFCRERLASYKCPRNVRFVTALPRDPNGKLYKRRLREPYWEGRELRGWLEENLDELARMVVDSTATESRCAP